MKRTSKRIKDAQAFADEPSLVMKGVLEAEEKGRMVVIRHREATMLRMKSSEQRRLHELNASVMLSKLPKSKARPSSPHRFPKGTAPPSNLSTLVAALGHIPSSVSGAPSKVSPLAFLESVQACEAVGADIIAELHPRTSPKSPEHEKKPKQRASFAQRTKDRVKHRQQQQSLQEAQHTHVTRQRDHVRAPSAKAPVARAPTRPKDMDIVSLQTSSASLVSGRAPAIATLLKALQLETPPPAKEFGKSFSLELLDTAHAVDEQLEKLASPTQHMQNSYNEVLELHKQRLQKVRAEIRSTKQSALQEHMEASAKEAARSGKTAWNDSRRANSKQPRAKEKEKKPQERAPKPVFELLLDECRADKSHTGPGTSPMALLGVALMGEKQTAKEAEMIREINEEIAYPPPSRTTVKEEVKGTKTNGLPAGSAVRACKKKNACMSTTGCERDNCLVKKRLRGEWVREDWLLMSNGLPVRNHCGERLAARQKAVITESLMQGTAPSMPRSHDVAQGVPLRAVKKKRGNRTQSRTKKPRSQASPAADADPDGIDTVRREIKRLQDILHAKALALAVDADLGNHVAKKIAVP